MQRDAADADDGSQGRHGRLGAEARGHRIAALLHRGTTAGVWRSDESVTEDSQRGHSKPAAAWVE